MKPIRQTLMILLAMFAGLLAACAPADLDITPSPTPTVEPTATVAPTETPVPEFTPTPVEVIPGDVSGVDPQEQVNLIIASIPNVISGGQIQWNRNQSAEVENVRGVNDGVGRKVTLSSAGGGQADLVYAAFNSVEAAQAHYERLAQIRNNTATGSPRDNFPEPNAFGRGTYGSYAITQIDNLYVEVSVQVFSSTSGDPLPGLMRSAIQFAEEGRALAEQGPIQLDPVLMAILDALPDEIEANGEIWTRGDQAPILVESGEAVEVQYRAGTTTLVVYVAHFTIPSAALDAYESIFSRGTTGVLFTETVIAVRGTAPELEMMSAILAAVEPALAE